MARLGLRLSEMEYKGLSEEYERARCSRYFDTCLRIQGLRLVHEGNREADAAGIITVGRRTPQDWIHRFRDRGLSDLRKGRFKGAKSKLTDEQKAELFRIIQAGPQEASLDTGVWTTPIIVKLVKDLYGVSYHPEHMGRILHKLGYSVQYPTKKPSEADERVQKIWPLTTLPEIKKARKDNGVVMYEDGAVFHHPGAVHRTWALVGIGTQVLGAPVRRIKKGMVAVRIGPDPMWHSRFVEVFNADTFVDLLKQLVRYYRGTKIHLITDNVAYHKAPRGREWLDGKEALIELHFLPPYSPKLSAVEYVRREPNRR